MSSTIRIFSAKISNADTSTDPLSETPSNPCSGFTLLELIISMTIISMVMLVLYFAFSIGSRNFDRDDPRIQEITRLEAMTRLVERDLSKAVSYRMNWEKGGLSLFAGGPRSIFYVTGNGAAAFSGPGAGLFFSLLYVDQCPENGDDCLYIYKSSRPSPEYVQALDTFIRAGEFGREGYAPGPDVVSKSLPVWRDVEDFSISYSQKDYQPFAGPVKDNVEQPLHEPGLLPESHWVADELPGQVRVSITMDGHEYVVHVPVGAR